MLFPGVLTDVDSSTGPPSQQALLYQPQSVTAVIFPQGDGTSLAGQTFTQGAKVTTGFYCTFASRFFYGLRTCNDSNGGVVTPEGMGELYGSGRLDTTTPGAHAYTVTATGVDGLTSSTAVDYTVDARLSGKVFDAAGNGVAGVPVIVDRSDGTEVTPVRTTGPGGSYVYNLPPGTYTAIAPTDGSDTVARGSGCEWAVDRICVLDLSADRTVDFDQPAAPATVAGSGPAGSGDGTSPAGPAGSATAGGDGAGVTGTSPSSATTTTGPSSATAKASTRPAGRAGIGRISARARGLAVPLSCTGASATACALSVTLTASMPAAHGHRARTVEVGSTRLSLAAAHTRTLALSLNRTGRRLLATRGRLTVRLVVTETGRTPRRTVVRALTLRRTA